MTTHFIPSKCVHKSVRASDRWVGQCNGEAKEAYAMEISMKNKSANVDKLTRALEQEARETETKDGVIGQATKMTAERWNMIRDDRLISDKTPESSDGEKEERAMRQLSQIPTGPIQQEEDPESTESPAVLSQNPKHKPQILNICEFPMIVLLFS